MAIAIYPGSFDPVTLGHMDVAMRAAKVFDKVYFGVYSKPHKDMLFNQTERIKMAKQAFAHVDNIEVCGYSGLTVAPAETGITAGRNDVRFSSVRFISPS